MATSDVIEERDGVTLLWRIENFTYCTQKKEQRLESPLFNVEVLDGTTWYLRIYPRGCDGNSEVNVYLCFHSNSRVVIDYEIAFLSANGSPLVVGQYKNKEIINSWGYGIRSYPTQKEIFLSRNSEFLPQDTLTVRCRLWKPNKSVFRPELYFARTRINVHRRSFLWTVPEFSNLQLDGKGAIKTVPGFVVKPTFNFELSLYGLTITHATVNVRVHQVCDVFSKCFATCKVSVLHAKGEVLKCLKDMHWFESGEKTWRLPYFLSRKDLEGKWLVGDELRLYCEFTVTFDNDPNETENVCPVTTHNAWTKSLLDIDTVKKKTDSQSILQEDLLSLYRDRTMCDFELRSEDVSFPVHKLLLIARSPVFKAMFSSDMKERAGDFLDIPDVDADTLDKLLLFVYTGTAEILMWESASKLYYAADKYEVVSLKQKCSVFLRDNITVDNVCEIVILADMHSDDDLKSSVHDFIVHHDDKIIRSVKWKQFVVSNPVLAAETMQVIYSKKLDMSGV